MELPKVATLQVQIKAVTVGDRVMELNISDVVVLVSYLMLEVTR